MHGSDECWNRLLTCNRRLTMGIEIILDQTEILDARTVGQGLQKRRGQAKGKLKKLDDEARKRGYKPKTGPRAQFGLRQKYRAREEVKPGPGEKGSPVQELTFELSLSELEKDNSTDQAAIATVRIEAGDNVEEYDMFLEALDGDFLDAREFMVEKDKVVLANSWWSATRTCLTSTCASACVSSLITCSGAWSAYLLCVAGICGGCWAKCTACATCDCRWWCRWAAGCCRQ
jgi:hypothetical protein